MLLNVHLARLALAAGLAGLLLAAPARAQPAAPMHLTLAYDGHLIFKVLEMRFEENATPDGFGASVRLNSSGILAAFKHFDIAATARGRTEDGVVRPGDFAYVNHDGKRVRHMQVVWGGGAVTMTTAPAFSNMGDPPATTAQKLISADPLTQLVRITLASSQSGPCNGDSHFFDGKQYYRLDLVPAGTGFLDDRAKRLGLINGVRCTVNYREVAGFKRKPPEKRNGGLKGPISIVFGQLGPNGPWVIARMQAETPLGYADIELRGVQLTGAKPRDPAPRPADSGR